MGANDFLGHDYSDPEPLLLCELIGRFD